MDALEDHDYFDIEPTLSSAVKAGRSWTGQSMRRLAKTSGISAAQISRIESGKVKRPTVETLLALAAALDHHPTPMLVLGRQATGSSARRQLAELIKAMLSQNDPDDRPGLKEVQASLRNADAGQLRQVAIELLTYPNRKVAWPHEITRAVPARVPDQDLFGRLHDAWTAITPDRRWRLVQLAQDMQAATAAERSSPVTDDPKERIQ